MSRSLLALTAVLALVALTGCGPRSVAVDTVGGFPPGVLPEEILNGEPVAVWDGGRLHIPLGGSSSCPPVLTAVEETAGTARVRIETAGWDPCTADMVFTTHVVRLEQGRPESVLLVGDDWERELEVRSR